MIIIIMESNEYVSWKIFNKNIPIKITKEKSMNSEIISYC